MYVKHILFQQYLGALTLFSYMHFIINNIVTLHVRIHHHNHNQQQSRQGNNEVPKSHFT